MAVGSHQCSPHAQMLQLFGQRQSPGNSEGGGGNVQAMEVQVGGRMGPPPRPQSTGSLKKGGEDTSMGSGERRVTELNGHEDSASDKTI